VISAENPVAAFLADEMAEEELRYPLIQFRQDCGSIKARRIGQ